ncbi:uncharacterized protein EDB93DRAFT_1250116 [Suillus bovinus]|uniref:uncharacterized protein n=1 Tax=Suillus bovinus TaxID=48563 RepID=UPI001B876F08|nr:uncharacterized protein EDB93DRAFT_1250116 [Suillus bovinus]KAG2148682.1 hypothetical protein EDB93DRAFT_1250116 [Suillus bovinus]
MDEDAEKEVDDYGKDDSDEIYPPGFGGYPGILCFKDVGILYFKDAGILHFKDTNEGCELTSFAVPRKKLFLQVLLNADAE